MRKHTWLSEPSRKPGWSSAGGSMWAIFWWPFLWPPSDGLNCSSLCDCLEVSLDSSTVLSAVFGTWKLSSDQGSTQLFFPKHFQTTWSELPGFFVCLFLLQVVSGLGVLKNWFAGGLEDVKQVCVSSALLATAVFMDLTHYLSDSALSTASPGKITQNKPGASALSLCAGLSLPAHGHSSILIQYSLSLPQPCLFLWHLLLVSLSSCFHFVFLWGPGS